MNTTNCFRSLKHIASANLFSLNNSKYNFLTENEPLGDKSKAC